MASIINIVAIDKRLAKGVINFGPSSHETIVVDETTPMPDLMRQIKDAVWRRDYPRTKIGMLVIAAHGYGEQGADGKTRDGFGMQLCYKDLDMTSVQFFRALDGLFANHELGITLLGCGVAAQERVNMGGGIVKTGFGEDLCKAIAVGTATGVMASSTVQKVALGQITARIKGRIETVDVMDPGAWEGDVWLFKPDGSKTRVSGK